MPDSTGRFVREGREYFAKVATLDEAARLDCEADGLAALRATHAVRVPALVETGKDDEHGWLLLEHLELVPLDARGGAALGAAIAALHRLPRERFGWERDNFIGASVQPNGWSDDWLDFWRMKRLMFQLGLAAKNRLPSRLIERGERLAADCDVFFRGYVPEKSLLHGDLWGGNAGALPDAMPVIFDPAVYVGDREADLAMTAMFGGFPSDFHAAYQAAWPLDDGYHRVRRDFYMLYHVLNHANLFAGGYVARAQASIERTLAEIR